MAAHALANDPTIDPMLRRAFATVTHQMVRFYDNGDEWSWNLNRLQTPDRHSILASERARIGDVDVMGRTLVAVEVRAL